MFQFTKKINTKMQFSITKNMLNLNDTDTSERCLFVNRTNAIFVVIPIKHHILNTVLNRPIP